MKRSRDEVEKMYQLGQQGKTRKQIAAMYGFSTSTLSRLLSKYGFSRHYRLKKPWAIQNVLNYPIVESKGETISIPLTKGYETIVDDINRDLLEYNWGVTEGYATTKHKGANVFIHRVILSRKLGRLLQANEKVDHINLNKLDNRLSNLRLATNSQNMWNTGKTKSNTSGFKGVYFNKAKEKFHASALNDGKKKHLGYFDTPEEAHEEYRKFVETYRGEFARFE